LLCDEHTISREFVALREPAALEAFQEASNDGRRTTVLKLIDGGVNVNQSILDRETALFDAIRGGDEELFSALLDRGANPNLRSRGGTPLTVAAGQGRNDFARVLLDHGAQVDAADEDGRTSLTIAAMRGNLKLVQLLLQHAADVAHTDNKGKTAAAYAEEEGYREITAMLASKSNARQ